jgi:hypothetical protein
VRRLPGLSTDDPFVLGLTSSVARDLVRQLEDCLRPEIDVRENSPPRSARTAPLTLEVDEKPLLELTPREGMELYFAFLNLLDEGASGTAEHNHVYAEDYSDDFAVWIDPTSPLRVHVNA